MTVAEIDAELKRLNKQRRKLLAKRRQLIIERRPEAVKTSQFWADSIFSIIESHPGASRSTILAELSDQEIARQVLTNCLTMLRRHGAIENRGTRKTPKWYAKDNVIPPDERYDEAGWFNVYGRCDTCGAPCDSKGCTSDPQHEIAIA